MRIAVVGAFNMDLVARVSRHPERGEALPADSFAIYPGGKGCNQAIAAARLGAQVVVVGRVGSDDFGAQFLDTRAAEGIDSSHVGRDLEEGTGIGMPVVFDDGSNSIIFAPRANHRLTPAEVQAAAPLIAGSDLLLLQLEVPMVANLAAATVAREAGVAVLLNPAPAVPLPAELLEATAFLVPNQVEAAMLTHDATMAAADQARSLYREGMRAVIVTLGPQGAVAFTSDGHIEVPAFDVEAVDTTGAGDAFCAALAVASLEGRDLPAAMRFASAAAAISVTRLGASTSFPSRREVDDFLAARRDCAPPRPVRYWAGAAGRFVTSTQRFCPVCNRAFTRGEAVLRCSGCNVLHHPGCWVTNNGCATSDPHRSTPVAVGFEGGPAAPPPGERVRRLPTLQGDPSRTPVTFSPRPRSSESTPPSTTPSPPPRTTPAPPRAAGPPPPPAAAAGPVIGEDEIPAPVARPRAPNRYPAAPAPLSVGRRGGRVYRGGGLAGYWYIPVAALLAIAVAFGVIWAAGTLFGDDDDTPAGGDTTATPATSPTRPPGTGTASPDAGTTTPGPGLRIGDGATVQGTGSCLNVRPSPGQSNTPVACLNDGTDLTVIGGPQASGGITWWQVRSGTVEGWAAEEFIRRKP